MSRQERVASAIKKEVSIIIHDKLNDPRLGFVTITKVELTPDLRFVKIFFSVLGKEEDFKKTKEALDSASGLIRKLIAKRINLRLAPEISFCEDRSSEYSVRIQQVLDEIKDLSEIRKEKRSEHKKSRRVRKKT
jgi:ribosome-binding factor A